MPKNSKQWVFDTVVISNFALTDSIFVLEKRYQGRGIITNEIYGELLAGIEKHSGLASIDLLFSEAAFKRVTLSKQEMLDCQELLTSLGFGEASAIVYAHHYNHIVVTDDRAARNICNSMAVPVTGTIGILKACVLDSTMSLEEADNILEKMIFKGFYSPVKSITDIL